MDWYFLTFLGDSTLLLPAALILFLLLLAAPNTRHSAWQWALLIGTTGSIICLSKLAFLGWGIGIESLDFTGFSGHSALSAAIWPCFIWLLSANLAITKRTIIMILSFIIPFCIGMSRLAIHVHSLSEVISGLLLGYLTSGLFLWLQRTQSQPRLTLRQLALTSFLLLFLIGQQKPAPTQSLLAYIATTIANIPEPYTRNDLHASQLTSAEP